MLGWRPDGPVYFRYRVFSDNTGMETCPAGTTQCPSNSCCQICGDPTAVPPTPDVACVPIGQGLAPQDSGLGAGVNLAGIDWNQEGITAGTVPPWCVVEAEADMDLDGVSVFVRGNSYNNRIYRSPNPEADGVDVW